MSYQEFLNQEPNLREAFELQPHLVGNLLEVRPLRPEDWESLFAVASDPLIWEQHPAHDRYKKEVFKEFFREALESGGAFVVIDRETQEVIGSSRYFGSEPRKQICRERCFPNRANECPVAKSHGKNRRRYDRAAGTNQC